MELWCLVENLLFALIHKIFPPYCCHTQNNSMIEMLDLRDNHLEDDSGIAIANMLENNVNIIRAVSI